MDSLRVGLRGVVLELGSVYIEHHVSAVGDTLLCGVAQIVAEKHSHHLFAELVGKLAGLAEKLEGNVLHLPVSLLGKYIYVFIIVLVHSCVGVR